MRLPSLTLESEFLFDLFLVDLPNLITLTFNDATFNYLDSLVVKSIMSFRINSNRSS